MSVIQHNIAGYIAILKIPGHMATVYKAVSCFNIKVISDRNSVHDTSRNKSVHLKHDIISYVAKFIKYISVTITLTSLVQLNVGQHSEDCQSSAPIHDESQQSKTGVAQPSVEVPAQRGREGADDRVRGHVQPECGSSGPFRHHLGDGTIGDDVEDRSSCNHGWHQHHQEDQAVSKHLHTQ